MSVKKLVRLKPFDRRKGQLARRWTYRGQRFEVDRGWYEVDAIVADELAKLRHPNTDALQFDVMTRAEADALEAREREEATLRKPTASPNKATFFTREHRPGVLLPEDLPNRPAPKRKRGRPRKTAS